MSADSPASAAIAASLRLPEHRTAYFGGAWHEPRRGGYVESINPGTGEGLGRVADCTTEDVEAAIAAARSGFEEWRRTPPLERARLLERAAAILREHAGELAMIDAAGCGNPVREMVVGRQPHMISLDIGHALMCYHAPRLRSCRSCPSRDD